MSNSTTPAHSLSGHKPVPPSRPVIERAKVIIMERLGCGQDEAFDTLRAVSQRSNVPVRIIASSIVEATSPASAVTRG